MAAMAAEFGRAHAIDHAYETLAAGSFQPDEEHAIGEGCYIAEVLGAAEAVGAVTKERIASWVRDLEQGVLTDDPRVRAFCDAAAAMSQEILRGAARKRAELARLLGVPLEEVVFSALGPQGQLVLQNEEDGDLILEPDEAVRSATAVIRDDL